MVITEDQEIHFEFIENQCDFYKIRFRYTYIDNPTDLLLTWDWRPL